MPYAHRSRHRLRALSTVALLVGAFLFHVPETGAQTGSCSPALGEANLSVGGVFARILNNGNLFWRGEPSVYYVGGKQPIFTAGFWIGGKADDSLRVASARYGPYEFWAGPLDDVGNPPDDCTPYDKVWSVNKTDYQDYLNGMGTTEDLASWPTGLGAPTLAPAFSDGVDNNGDGFVDEEGEAREIHKELLDSPLSERVDRVIDLDAGERPLFHGDQMLWWIMNDRGNSHNHSDTPPIGIEAHGLAFAFDEPAPLGTASFYKVTVFYADDDPLDSAYVSIFVDPDLGDPWDDYVGSDTTLSIGFAYNSDNSDDGDAGYGQNPPTVGVSFLQGPIVPSPGSIALVSGEPVDDYKNLGMTSFVRFNNGGGIDGDPSDGEKVYNFMRARWKDGSPIRAFGDGVNQAASHPETMFMFPGAPESNAFWSERNSDGLGSPTSPGDRRFMLTSGPFTLNPGDRQEIVYSINWARGTSNLDSVTRLFAATSFSKAQADSNFQIVMNVATEATRADVALSAVYPNPAVDALTIVTGAAFRDNLEITVTDLLGRVVARQSYAAHAETIRLDVSALASGRYFVRLESGDRTETHVVVKPIR